MITLSLPLTDAEHPLSEDRPVNKRLAPERSCTTWEMDAELQKVAVRDETDCRRRKRGKVMVHRFEVEGMKVGYFAADVE